MFIRQQADISCTFRTHKYFIKSCIVLALIFIITFCVGCSYNADGLTEAENKRVDEIVRGLVEADIIFPFDSTEDIPLVFYPTYLSMRCSGEELQLNEEMQANINCEQMMSIIQPDWGIEEIALCTFSHGKEDFLMTVQFGLQGKDYAIDNLSKENDTILASVTVERSLDLINDNISELKLYAYTINYKFKTDNNHVTLVSADLPK